MLLDDMMKKYERECASGAWAKTVENLDFEHWRKARGLTIGAPTPAERSAETAAAWDRIIDASNRSRGVE